MNQEYWDRLIHGYLDDMLSADEHHEFAALMSDSEAARSRFWELAEVHGLARDAARLAWANTDAADTRIADAAVDLPADVVQATVVARTPHGRFPWLRPAGLVAAGLALGVLTTGLAWAISRPQVDAPQALFAESFESGDAIIAGGVPTRSGVWSGDETERVQRQTEVTPVDAQHMLRFVRVDYPDKPKPGGYVGEVYRLLDLSSVRSEVADGNAVVQLSARFNAGQFAAGDQDRCSVAVFALDRATATDGSTRDAMALLERSLATTRRSNDLLDRDPSTWQRVSAELRLPADTEFLLLRIAVAHGPPSRTSPGHETFGAHFADDIRVTLVRRPALP